MHLRVGANNLNDIIIIIGMSHCIFGGIRIDVRNVREGSNQPSQRMYVNERTRHVKPPLHASLTNPPETNSNFDYLPPCLHQRLGDLPFQLGGLAHA